ncbi:MAG: hypothetical protein IKZ45_00420 [Fibrobacter sp.]|nr:hypothetical protein [Fibrobacter sp.]
MYKFVIAVLLMFILCSCAGTRTVDFAKDSNDPKGMVHIDNKWGVTAVFIDNEFAGNTPLYVSLPQGEHRIVMNYGGKIVHDTTIVVTDDYERNGNAAIMGGAIGSFVTVLLVPFPANLLAASFPMIVAGASMRLNVDDVVINTRQGYSATSQPAPHKELGESVPDSGAPRLDSSVAASAPFVVPAPDTSEHELLPEVADEQGEFGMYEVDGEKYVFLKERRNDVGNQELVVASSICYEPSSDLVWAYETPLRRTNVYYSDEFIPCEVDSIPYRSKVGPMLLRLGITAGIWSTIGLLAGGIEGAIVGGLSGTLFYGGVVWFLSDWVMDKRNATACQNIRRKDQVKEWYSQFPCRQNTNPIPESKNQ